MSRTVVSSTTDPKTKMSGNVHSESNSEITVKDLDLVMRSLIEMLKKPARKRPRNILLIGRPSAGKSSLINLMRAALCAQYEEVAKPGSAFQGSTNSITGHLKYFPNMGLDEEDLATFKSFHGLPNDFQLPTIIDMPGMVDRTNCKYDVLKYVLDGAVPDEGAILSAMNEGLPPKNLRFNDMGHRKIDLVVFVVSILQDAPEEMFKQTLRTICFSNGTHTREVPYILVFTHVDRIESSELTRDTIKDRKKSAASILKIGENMKLNSHEIANYCDEDEISPENVSRYATNLSKNHRALQLLCKMFRSRLVLDDCTAVNKSSPNWDHFQRIKDVFLDIFLRNGAILIERMEENILILILFMLIAILIYMYLKK